MWRRNYNFQINTVDYLSYQWLLQVHFLLQLSIFFYNNIISTQGKYFFTRNMACVHCKWQQCAQDGPWGVHLMSPTIELKIWFTLIQKYSTVIVNLNRSIYLWGNHFLYIIVVLSRCKYPWSYAGLFFCWI